MTDRAPSPGMRSLHRLGLASWSLLGVVALVVVAATALGALRGIVVPLVVAAILGTVLEPLVELLERRGVPQVLATMVAMLVAIALAAGTIGVIVAGFIQQLPEITRELVAGWESLVAWVRSLEIDSLWLERARTSFQQHAPQLGYGVLGAVSSTFSGAISFIVGAFFALYFLFFVIRDLRLFPAWLARTTTLDAALVAEVTGVAKQSLRGYFRGTAITAVVTAPIFMVPLLLLDVPLAGPIFVFYFFMSFVPYIGAWITGIFAVLIAFGSGGASDAAILAVTFTISNGMIQNVVNSWALGSALKLHPMSVLLATLVGGAAAGLMGMVLGAPLLSAVVGSVRVVKAHGAAGSVSPPAPAG